MRWLLAFCWISIVALWIADYLLIRANRELRKANQNLQDALTSALQNMEIRSIRAVVNGDDQVE